MSLERINEILKTYSNAGRDKLIPLLQDVQAEQGFLSKESVQVIGRHLGLPASKIFGVATFYNQFRFEPMGQFHIQVCRGTACHVKGSLPILESIQKELEIQPGRTSKDGVFSLEVVACIGACGLAPVIAVNGEFHARLESDQVAGIIESYRKKAV